MKHNKPLTKPMLATIGPTNSGETEWGQRLDAVLGAKGRFPYLVSITFGTFPPRAEC